ncbi:MAG: Gfo/Idh/MocA family oxidoreductase [Clostridia bacterium]|nr:Gfo/Idh/MocA family oxidoreductase [Clostridia bacterium]MBQ7546257.1 Gfo/Idh/MocA family oxidoreductase [Clostridia bacterium]
MDKKLIVACIGMQFGMSHVEGAMSCGAEIAAICDSNPENLRAAGERYGIPEEKRFTDYMDIVRDPRIEVVTVAVPDQQHCRLSCDLLRAGKHVLCEKPLALTREDLREIIRAADESGRKFMVGQICRFTPAFEKAKALIDDGTLGELYFVESEYAHDYMYLVDTWRSDPLRHGVIGGGCHAVDLLRWLAGDPQEVFAYGMHKLLPQVAYDDATIAVMKFDDNLAGKVFVSTGCKRNYTMRTVIYGTKGTLICDNTSPTMTLFTVGENGMATEPQTLEVQVNNHNAAKEFEVFADAIMHDKPVITDAREGAKTVEVCLSIVESSKTGKVVRPDYSF